MTAESYSGHAFVDVAGAESQRVWLERGRSLCGRLSGESADLTRPVRAPRLCLSTAREVRGRWG